MKWPWQRDKSSGTLAFNSTDAGLGWARVDRAGAPLRCGFVARGSDSPADFLRRVRDAVPAPREATAVLPLPAAQWLRIDAPAVRAEELRAAARWHIKEYIEGPLDELTLDVMEVDTEPMRAAKQLFVVAAHNRDIRDTTELARGAGWELGAIDVAETVQRNLQCAVVAGAGLGGRASAALMVHGTQCLLTFCADGELYDTRRLEWEGTGERSEAPASATPADDALELDFVDYGADDEAGPADDGHTPRIVIELQRSFDVWERSWPDRPLAGLWVEAGPETAALVALLRRALGLRVEALDAAALFPGFVQACPDAAQRQALLPLLGGLLRTLPAPLRPAA
jgi:MSHA biogenesis protein MshI